ncbi:DUF2529 domain-containing protein [Lederbergia sp. NSJ-179]|uniref:DUF2529 domain-containing protein n=1 Tax=Lederbergia sp. NSJ-179 TaxID=2931402 RepID=UPI001FD5CC96|nr:DUF2529 domain-containing protein [Lederbergia sp. NSJ-179]MCJ7840552.1 DUF2529 domain-containing protein [Lederbergia sp. NSJ-179]
MQKMFTTQLLGLFNRIMDHEADSIEDGARLLAQASAGEGTIYIKGFDEMEGVISEAIHGQEPLQNVQPLPSVSELKTVDRVLLMTRFSDDQEAVQLAEKLEKKGISFVAISGIKKSEAKQLPDLADVHINTYVLKPLLPNEDGSRMGFPSLIAALYIYSSIKFVLDEILMEYK